MPSNSSKQISRGFPAPSSEARGYPPLVGLKSPGVRGIARTYPQLLGGPLAVSKANNPQPLGLKSPALRGYLAVNAVNNPQLLGLYEAHSYPPLVGLYEVNV